MTKDPKKLFGLRVRQLRKDRDWSQEYLAFRAKLDRTYISSIEQGQRNVALVNICNLAKAFKVQPHELLEFKKIDT